MPAKAGTKKSAKSEDDTKKKDTTKTTKKSVEDTTSADPTSVINDNASAKLAAINVARGTSQLGTPLDEHSNKEGGISTSELSHYADGNRESEGGFNSADGVSGAFIPEIEVKYEEPILPNLIVLRFG